MGRRDEQARSFTGALNAQARADEYSAERWLDDGGRPLGETLAPTVGSDASHQFWQNSMAPHELPSQRRSLLDLATSVGPYLALTVAMYLSLNLSVWITLALAVPAAGFLLRTFIVFHDCAHARSCRQSEQIVGSGGSPACSSYSHSGIGATSTRSITGQPVTSTGAEPATY